MRRLALLALLLVLGGAGAALAQSGAPNTADGTRPDDDLPPDTAQTLLPPGVLDGLWRVTSDDGADSPIVLLDIAHAEGRPRAAGVFTALPGLCPPASDGVCDWDGTMGEITDIVMIDGGVIISLLPGYDVADEQNLRLKPAADGVWRGTIDDAAPRPVVMTRPGD